MLLCKTTITLLLCFPVPGVAANAKVGSELIKVVAIDNDIGNNSLVQYHIVTIRYFQSPSNGSEDVGSIFTIGQRLYLKDSLLCLETYSEDIQPMQYVHCKVNQNCSYHCSQDHIYFKYLIIRNK